MQADEIWGYASRKEAHKLQSETDNDSNGDAYCYVAMERHFKLALNFALGRRSQATTDAFIEGLRHATAPGQRLQITADGFQPYISGITTTLSGRCDYEQHIRAYGANQDNERRYSPPTSSVRRNVPVRATPKRSGFAPAISNARTSPFVCRCAAWRA